APVFEHLETRVVDDSIFVVAFNRPSKFNSLSPEMYDSWKASLEWARDQTGIRVVILTGYGRYFTAGQELAVPRLLDGETPEEYSIRRVQVTKELIDLLITFPKLLIFALNGPAVGFGVTCTALADLVYCVPQTTFQTPFMDLALCVEACSTVTFPRALGRARANDLLLMGKTFTAKEFLDAGLVNAILPEEHFLESVLGHARKAAAYAPDALRKSLGLIKLVDRDRLLQMNELEMKLLVERLGSEEFQQVVLAFMTAKSQKRASKL
ncbi:Enoyl-CoA delta isomerase 2, mitochondrial, partial [Kappamyces sp. JEL0680]